MILQKGEYDFKTAVTTPYVFKSKNRWIIFLVHLHFLNIDIHQLQTVGSIPHVILLELLSHHKLHGHNLVIIVSQNLIFIGPYEIYINVIHLLVFFEH
jgi:hypothetical protein